MLWWTLQKLKSSDWHVRAEAARTLAAARETKAVPSLIKALDEDIGEERLALVEALGTIAHPAAVDALVSALKDQPRRLKTRRKDLAAGTNVAEYKSMAEALARIGSPSLHPLIGILDSEDRETRRWAAHALGLMRDPGALDPLAARLQDSRSEVRQAAARALGNLGHPRAVQPLLKIVGGKDPEARRAAVEALGMLGVEEAIDVLGVAAQDSNEPLQLAAVEALRRIGGLRAGRKIRPVLETGRRAVREAAAAALASMRLETATAEDRAAGAVLRSDFEAALREGLSAVEPVISALGSRDAGHRVKAVKALATLHSERSLRSLLLALDDHDRTVQEAAANALAATGQPAVAGLKDLLASGHSSVRRLAAVTLGRIGAPEAVDALVDASLPNRNIQSDDSESLAAVSAAACAISGLLAKAGGDVSRNTLDRIAAMPDHPWARGMAQPRDTEAQQLCQSWAVILDLVRQELHRRCRL